MKIKMILGAERSFGADECETGGEQETIVVVIIVNINVSSEEGQPQLLTLALAP